MAIDLLWRNKYRADRSEPFTSELRWRSPREWRTHFSRLRNTCIFGVVLLIQIAVLDFVSQQWVNNGIAGGKYR